MKKRFIICVNSFSKYQEEEFINYLRTQNLAWWHWISNVWLVSDRKGRLKASDLRDKCKEIFDGQNNMVIELNQLKDTWAGFGPRNEQQNMFKWIKKYWKRD